MSESNDNFKSITREILINGIEIKTKLSIKSLLNLKSFEEIEKNARNQLKNTNGINLDEFDIAFRFSNDKNDEIMMKIVDQEDIKQISSFKTKVEDLCSDLSDHIKDTRCGRESGGLKQNGEVNVIVQIYFEKRK